MTDFDIDVAPGVVFDDITSYIDEHDADGAMKVEVVENKHFIIY